MSDMDYMKQCLVLAAKGKCSTFPNPMVGSLVVKDNAIVGEGFHLRAGEAHAEIHALNAAGERARGATLYVSLEPCCHQGRTPPCVDAIIKSGIKKVVIAMQDPNPKVSGQGMQKLRAAGIEVVCGVLEQEAQELNRAFVHYITTKRPFVVAKWAMSLDGLMQTQNPHERQLTDGLSQSDLHETRQLLQGILIGSETARMDNPSLTVRFAQEIQRQPQRIVLNSSADLDPQLKLFNGELPGKTWLVCTDQYFEKACARFDAQFVEVIAVAANAFGKVDIMALLNLLGERELMSVLVEGGRKVLNEFFKLSCVNEIECYLAPYWVGDLPHKLKLNLTEVQTLGDDRKIKGCL